MAKIYCICREKFENKYVKDKIFWKVRDHFHGTGEYGGAAHSIKFPIVFHNGSNYDYHFIIKKIAEGIEKQFTCLEENTKKYITFTVTIEKEVIRIDKNGEEVIKNIS